MLWERLYVRSEMGNMTDGILQLSIGTKINTLKAALWECAYSVCLCARVWNNISLCRCVSEIIWCLSASCFPFEMCAYRWDHIEHLQRFRQSRMFSLDQTIQFLDDAVIGCHLSDRAQSTVNREIRWQIAGLWIKGSRHTVSCNRVNS